MNISSMVVYSGLTDLSGLIKDINSIDGCEVIISQNGKIVVVSEADNTDGQIKIFRTLERLDGVDSVGMVYSYEENSDEDIKDEISKMLSDEFDAKDVKYGGDANNFI